MIEVREYAGGKGCLVLVHGGPGAAGYMRPLAEELAPEFRVLEPLQRQSGGECQTVQRHIDDLAEVISNYCPHKPIILGHSWGAMLALAHAAQHPEQVGALVLVGCGTFDPEARAVFRENIRERTTGEHEIALREIMVTECDPNVQMEAMGRVYADIYAYDLMLDTCDAETVDARGHEETWNDMIAQQEKGVYPQSFSSITCPVLMIHGQQDPHPGAMVRDSLKPYIPQLECIELDQCGHSPWCERHAHDRFYKVLRAWLAEHMVIAPTCSGDKDS